MRRTGCVVGIALLVVACQSGSVSTASPAPTASHAPTPTHVPRVLLVFTPWVPDPKVGNGPEPGYRPALSDLTGHDVESAAAIIDNTGTSWVLNVSFTPRGTTLFAMLTRANVAACPDDPVTGAGYGCPQRHLAIWLDLTQADIDKWADATYVSEVSRPYDLGCLSRQPATTACPKLLSDPITLEEIKGGKLIINCGCTQSSAKELADAINAMAHP